MTPVLDVHDVSAGYGRTQVLRDVTLSVQAGAATALLGPNGAGKTTLLRVASGLLSPSSGEILMHEERLTGLHPFARAKRGLCLVPEGRGIFPNLSVRDNLRLAVPPWARSTGFEPAFEPFPVLRERLHQTAGSLSGGQQQMLALSRCFLSHPKVVLLDEVSMGLAPKVIDEIFAALATLRAQGTALLLVEQYVARALEIADHVYVLARGNVTFSGSPSALDEDELARRYLSAGD